MLELAIISLEAVQTIDVTFKLALAHTSRANAATQICATTRTSSFQTRAAFSWAHTPLEPFSSTSFYSNFSFANYFSPKFLIKTNKTSIYFFFLSPFLIRFFIFPLYLFVLKINAPKKLYFYAKKRKREDFLIMRSIFIYPKICGRSASHL